MPEDLPHEIDQLLELKLSELKRSYDERCRRLKSEYDAAVRREIESAQRSKVQLDERSRHAARRVSIVASQKL